LIQELKWKTLNYHKANKSIPAGLYWTSGADEGCEGKFGWCSVNKLVRNAQWASAQPDNVGGSENCLGLNLDTAKADLQDEDCTKLLPLICEAITIFDVEI
jgi:Lectin C-type domain